MKTTIFILSFLVLGCSTGKSDFKNYDKLAWKAMLQYQDKEFDKSLKNFKKAFKVLPDENVTHYFYAAAAALHLDKENEAKNLIIESIIQTNASKNYYFSFAGFDQFRELEIFSEIEKDYDRHIAQFYKNLKHPNIYREIDSLLLKDQEIRKNTVTSQEFRLVDSLNINRLMEITQQYGWQDKGWLILWHQRGTYKEDNNVWNFFLPHINKEIQEGTVRKHFWAIFEDEKSIMKEKQQIYGEYYSQFPIKDIENVDIRRDSIGLPPLWYMNKIYNIELPADYKKPQTVKKDMLNLS